MKEKRKFIYFSILVLLLIASWAYFYFLPIQTQIVKMESDNKLFRAKIKSAKQFEEKIPELTKQVVRFRKEINTTESKILDESSLESMVTLLEEEVQKYNINIKAVNPVLSSSENKVQISLNNINKLFIEITLEANFMNFTSFLDALNEFPLFINPKGIMITYNEVNSDNLTINLFAEILFKSGINK